MLCFSHFFTPDHSSRHFPTDLHTLYPIFVGEIFLYAYYHQNIDVEYPIAFDTGINPVRE